MMALSIYALEWCSKHGTDDERWIVLDVSLNYTYLENQARELWKNNPTWQDTPFRVATHLLGKRLQIMPMWNIYNTKK